MGQQKTAAGKMNLTRLPRRGASKADLLSSPPPILCSAVSRFLSRNFTLSTFLFTPGSSVCFFGPGEAGTAPSRLRRVSVVQKVLQGRKRLGYNGNLIGKKTPGKEYEKAIDMKQSARYPAVTQRKRKWCRHSALLYDFVTVHLKCAAQ
jgi:hypothetical protein